MGDVLWSERAVETLDAAIDHIEQLDQRAAFGIRARLIAAAESLQFFPHRGRPAGTGFREIATVPPYIIRYAVDGETVTIVRIRHGRRRPIA